MSAPAPASPLGVCYVLVNSFPTINVGKYTLEDGTPYFGVAIIFAANIDYDDQAQKAVLGFNANVQAILDDIDTQVRPLQQQGIKVLLNVLGNHTQAGISNFADQAAASDFAAQCADAVEKYGLDGIDFDDEWVDYGGTLSDGTKIPPVNAYSFPYLVQALRGLMPADKLISLYYYGPATSTLQYGKINVGDLLNYSWNPFYGGTWGPPVIDGLAKSGIAGAGIAINPVGDNPPQTPQSAAVAVAQETLQDGYGLCMYYDLPNQDMSSYLNGISQALYGQDVRYSG